MGDLRAVDGASTETGNVKRRQDWLDGHPGATIEADDYGWHVAKDKAGVLLGRRPELGDLIDFLERK